MRAVLRRETLVNLQGLEQQRLRGKRVVVGLQVALRAAASAKDNRVLTTAAVRRATLHAAERQGLESASTRDHWWNIKTSYCKKLSKVGPRPGSAPADSS